MKRISVIAASVALLLVAGGASAQEAGSLSFGGDHYAAGGEVATEAAVPGDAFLAGADLRVGHEVTGSVYAAGRRVDVAAPVGGGLVAVGQIVSVSAPVGGAATLAAAELSITAPIAGNLRAGAGALRLSADVGGSALLAGDEITLSSVIAGDARITGDEIRFDDGAQVGGALVVYVEDVDDFSVPERVAPAERVQIRPIDEAEDSMPDVVREAGRRSFRAALAGFVWGVIVVAAVAALAVAVAPNWVAGVRGAALARPGRAILAGFAGLSFLVGSGFVLALTLVGLLLLPATLLLAALAGLSGYVAGSYILGVGLWMWAGRAVPPHWTGKSGLAVLGALVAALAGLIPVIGWIAVLGLVLLGLGGMVLHVSGRRAGA